MDKIAAKAKKEFQGGGEHQEIGKDNARDEQNQRERDDRGTGRLVLLLDQLDPAVLGAAFLVIVRGDGCILAAAVRPQPGGGDAVPTESFSLNFEEYKETYTEYDAKGTKKGNVEATWKVEEGTK